MTDKTIGPLQDVQQAFRIVRTNATAWHVNPDRIGIVGFSAGGHLAATASNQYEQPILSGNSAALIRPNFAVLVYPVISMRDDITHAQSRLSLLGAQPSALQIARYSNELATTANTPPTLIVHAADDTAVPVANSLRYAESLTQHGVSVELIVYPHGGHGFGLHNSTTTDRWIDRCHDWLVSQKLLGK
jgi:acetyl esterase/lipase